MLYADGKVITPLLRAKPGDKRIDKRIGEVHYPCVEHDAALHVEGTGELVWGTKFVLIAARHPHPHSRFIVDVAHVPTSGGEAATAVGRFVELAPLLPGAQGVVYDTALRGVHHQRLMRDLGFDDTLWLRRAHSLGCRRQLLNLITYALGVNAMSMHVHRHGLAPPLAA